MRIRTLEVQNYRSIKALSLSFLDPFGQVRPLTVIAGPNGSGKTSLLSAIVQALRGVTGYRTNDVPEPTPLDIHNPSPAESGWRRIPSPRIKVRIDIEFDPSESETIKELCTRLGLQLPPLPDRRVEIEWLYPPTLNDDGSPKPWWYLESTTPKGPGVLNWLKALSIAIRARRQRLIPIEWLLKIGGIYIFPQDRALRMRVLGISEQGFLPLEEHAYQPAASGNMSAREDEHPEEPARKPDIPVVSILRYLTEQARLRETKPTTDLIWENRVIDAFSKICRPKTYVGFRVHDELYPQGAPCFKDANGVIYPLEYAASGEQVIIEYCARLNYQQPRNNHIILIDEPEAHLHPAWVRLLYFALPKIGEGNQYIVATHSPELRERAAVDKCLFDLGDLQAPATSS